MIGIYLLGVIGIYVFVWYWIVRWCKPRWSKWVLIAVAVAIPTWDMLPQHVAYRAACQSEAGEYVASEPIIARGFYYAFADEEAARSFVDELGFDYVEVYSIQPAGKTLVRVARESTESVKALPIGSPESQFEYSEFSRQLGSNLRAFGLQVIDRKSGQVLASHTTIGKRSTWVFRFLFPSTWPGDGGSCRGRPPRYPRLVPDFLSPASARPHEETSK